MTGPYGYADVGRGGLGNSLFPWARCFLWCRANAVPMIAPVWARLRIGPYIRRERDKRRYDRLFVSSGYVSGLRRFYCLTRRRKMPEGTLAQVSLDQLQGTVVVFRGMANYFSNLLGEHQHVRTEIERIARPGILSPTSERYIALHVRLGDFSTPAGPAVLASGSHNYRLPMGWYVAALRAVRGLLPGAAPAILFSDGYRDQLGEILSEPDVELIEPRNALADMLALAQARVLVASGSTFSMWASYLGQIPTLWHPGQRRQCVIGDGRTGDLEPAWRTHDAFSDSMVCAVRSRWSA